MQQQCVSAMKPLYKVYNIAIYHNFFDDLGILKYTVGLI